MIHADVESDLMTLHAHSITECRDLHREQPGVLRHATELLDHVSSTCDQHLIAQTAPGSILMTGCSSFCVCHVVHSTHHMIPCSIEFSTRLCLCDCRIIGRATVN